MLGATVVIGDTIPIKPSYRFCLSVIPSIPSDNPARKFPANESTVLS